jgi:hypothetical protein
MGRARSRRRAPGRRSTGLTGEQEIAAAGGWFAAIARA